MLHLLTDEERVFLYMGTQMNSRILFYLNEIVWRTVSETLVCQSHCSRISKSFNN